MFTIKTAQALLEYYLKRRRETVIQVMIEFRPEMIRFFHFDQFLNIEKKTSDEPIRSVPSIGIWNDEWKYRLHGIGCELKNLKTGEYFNWDLTNPNYFFLGEYEPYLNWQLKAQMEYRNILSYKAWVERKNGSFDIMIYYLQKAKFIQQVDGFLFEIIDLF